MKYEHEEEVIIAKSWCFSNKRETFYKYDFNNRQDFERVGYSGV